jgi:hypothetical protein
VEHLQEETTQLNVPVRMVNWMKGAVKYGVQADEGVSAHSNTKEGWVAKVAPRSAESRVCVVAEAK